MSKKKPYSDERWWKFVDWGNTVFDDSEVTDEDRRKSEKIKKEILDAAEKGKMNLKPKGWVPWDDSNE
ncbi:hypothetical protein [Ligilactobacillus salivarius]|uniref:hypothetical protein n=1 Tax=Ligilactobacillus salivarius TaxID=1624 RepID=UPI00237E9423|nr:hypothetical protein [Ligilactobacillus salivarius]MDE1506434.1 hypothetical protein [Ligilactobacillus salivarius]MDE1521215.1 hypothetical protein [Ligilactobacillus salivarius]